MVRSPSLPRKVVAMFLRLPYKTLSLEMTVSVPSGELRARLLCSPRTELGGHSVSCETRSTPLRFNIGIPTADFTMPVGKAELIKESLLAQGARTSIPSKEDSTADLTQQSDAKEQQR